MASIKIKTHSDGIWISMPREVSIVQQITHALEQRGFIGINKSTDNYGYPSVFIRDQQKLHCRLVDSVFLTNPDAFESTVITDNIPLRQKPIKLISVLPEFWSIWHFDPEFQDRPPVWAYNCFMNRPRGDRSIVFYELIKRKILSMGLVSFNVSEQECQTQFESADLDRYRAQHDQACVPFNNLTETLEQSIIDSKVSLVMETYISDSHVVFSEKIFRCLQMPRPWLLYCSPGSVGFLRKYGFDVLDNYVDHGYDREVNHQHRLSQLLDQLETFTDRTYNDQDYDKFQQSARHNRELLKLFAQQWPDKFKNIMEKIQLL
jgi:hypothetical protein